MFFSEGKTKHKLDLKLICVQSNVLWPRNAFSHLSAVWRYCWNALNKTQFGYHPGFWPMLRICSVCNVVKVKENFLESRNYKTRIYSRSLAIVTHAYGRIGNIMFVTSSILIKDCWLDLWRFIRCSSINRLSDLTQQTGIRFGIEQAIWNRKAAFFRFKTEYSPITWDFTLKRKHCFVFGIPV